MPDLTPSAATFPAALRERTRWLTLGGVPALVAAPEPGALHGDGPPPLVLWMHGRTVNKELDPGRYLRWVRAGIAACAIDLPGHGERHDPRLQTPEATLEVVERAVGELDGVVAALRERAVELGLVARASDVAVMRLGLGGMSAGGMATMVRLCRAHSFAAASVEATTGSWRWQMHRAMWDPDRAAALDPIGHLDQWRPIPFQAIHARHDEWVNVDGQREFIEALRETSRGGGGDPSLVEFHVFDERTGAPHEHAGFGRFGAQAKDIQLDFWRRTLGAGHAGPGVGPGVGPGTGPGVGPSPDAGAAGA